MPSGSTRRAGRHHAKRAGGISDLQGDERPERYEPQVHFEEARLVPALRACRGSSPQTADRRDVLERVEALGSASIDDYHQTRNSLDENRFYLDADQCRRAKEALDRIERAPVEVGRIVWSTNRFEPDPEINDGYLRKKRDGGR